MIKFHVILQKNIGSSMTNKLRLHYIIILFADLSAIYVSIITAFCTRIWIESFYPLIPLTHPLLSYIQRWWIIFIILAVITFHKGYGIVATVWDELLILLKSLLLSFLIVWAILSLQKETEAVSRIIVTLSFFYMIASLPLIRFFAKYLMYKVLDERIESFLIGEKGEAENKLVKSLNSEWYSGYRIKSIVNGISDINNVETCFIPVWYADEETVKNLKKKVKNLIMVSEGFGFSFMSTEIMTFLDKDMALITTKNGLLSGRKVFLKRVFDIILSFFILVFSIPLFLLIPILIKIDSKGPVFFSHTRCGLNMASFNMLKFRTMHANSGELIEKYINENPEAYNDLKERNKIKEDPRVTGLGKFLRKTSLDELPQLFNVMKGDMSIVGPRPDSKEALTDYYKDYKEIYMKVKPGITGLWQVSGRSDINYSKRVKLDYQYVLNWSLWFDIVIILKTFRAIISGKGAY
jgi:exopolysaccharide biosynthesis polyprenyl glycosylphosphotransferase